MGGPGSCRPWKFKDLRVARDPPAAPRKEIPMPLARIELRQGKGAAYRQKVGQVVYDAMLTTLGVPKNDRFQIIGEHAAENFIFDADYLDIHRTGDLIVIQVTLNEGRTVEQKKAFYKAVADGLAGSLNVRREDVLINLVEVKKENWSFGNGEAQYAT
jgi:phenylpyruvate tautomerase PptA (4-oxalocrotonate tautomerase family)